MDTVSEVVYGKNEKKQKTAASGGDCYDTVVYPDDSSHYNRNV